MKYYLMNKNVNVLEFTYDEEIHAITAIDKIINKAYAPIGIVDFDQSISRKLLNDWWQDRSIPASRSNFKEIMTDMQIKSPVYLLEICYGLSLSDQYWIKDVSSSLKWEDVNFFQNNFSDDMGNILFGNIKYSKDLNIFSPDNSSDGNLRKKWKIIDGKRCLIKGGNTLNNQEPFNEVIASKLYARLLNPDEYIPYYLIEENGQFYSCCETMVNTSEELVSAYYIDKTLKLKGSDSLYLHYIKACENLGIKSARVSVDKMIVCDYILSNYDRHYRNFGAIRNIETLKWERIAPLYDSGSSLYATSPTNMIGNMYRSKPFKADPKDQLLLVKDLSWFDPDKLAGFEDEVKDILQINILIEPDRIRSIQSLVRNNITKVCNLKKALDFNKAFEYDYGYDINKKLENLENDNDYSEDVSEEYDKER